jgi:hypothetical protein
MRMEEVEERQTHGEVRVARLSAQLASLDSALADAASDTQRSMRMHHLHHRALCACTSALPHPPRDAQRCMRMHQLQQRGACEPIFKKIKKNRQSRKTPRKRPVSRAKAHMRPETSQSGKSRDGTASAAPRRANACADVRACGARNPVICELKVRCGGSRARKDARAPSVAYVASRSTDIPRRPTAAPPKVAPPNCSFQPSPPSVTAP